MPRPLGGTRWRWPPWSRRVSSTRAPTRSRPSRCGTTSGTASAAGGSTAYRGRPSWLHVGVDTALSWADPDGDHHRQRGGYLHGIDRKSTRLNSSHVRISYAVFCLKKKKNSE